MIRGLIPYFSMMRPLNSIMASLAAIISIFIASGNSGLIELSVPFLICAAGMIINDYFDIEIDKINKPNRPLASGIIKKNNALIFSIVIFIIGISLSALINAYVFLLVIFNSIVEILYAWKGKQAWIFGNIAVSWLVASLFIYGGLISYNINNVIILALLAGFANLSRELYKTCDDVKGDKKQNAKTMATTLGVKKTRFVAGVLLLVLIPLSLLPKMNFFYLPTVSITDILFLVSIFKPEKSSTIIKYAMLFGLLAFLIGSINL